MAKFFLFPFADVGDKLAIPDDTQPDGSVSYESGFTSDYEKDMKTDPDAKPIPRNQTNQLYYDITNALRQYQTQGVPEFISAADNGGVAFPYDVNAQVRYDAGSGFKIYQSLVGSNSTLPTSGSWRVLSDSEVPVGAILDFGGTTAPLNFLNCDGSAVSRTTYAGLFAVIGTNFGVGDGSTTFNIPDFRRATPVGSGGTGTGTLGNAVGNAGGAEVHTMTIPEMAAHNHSGSFAPYTGNNCGGGDTPVVSPSGGSHLNVNVTSEGSGTPFNIMQPSLVTYKIIKYA